MTQHSTAQHSMNRAQFLAIFVAARRFQFLQTAVGAENRSEQ
jgi:hypothetical protein